MSLTTINILFNNALAYIQAADLVKADELLAKAHALDGKNPDILRLLSIVAAMKFNYVQALELIDAAIVLAPDNAIAHSNRGNILKEMNQFEAAINSLDKAIELMPDYAEVYNNKGNLLQSVQQYEESLVWYDKAIELQPSYAEAYSNKGNALEQLQLHDESIEWHDKATALNPQYTDGYWNKAMAQLRMGDFKNGWQNYEARWFKSNSVSYQYEQFPRLETLEDIFGKKVLIWAEQGLGDTFQFCRYIKLLKELGAQVTFLIQKPLLETLSSLNKYCSVVSTIEDMPGFFDFQSPLLTLPFIFGTNVKNIPAKIPYLIASFEKRDYFQKLYSKNKALKVGLVWNGGFRAEAPELWAINKRRNIDLELISQLRGIPGIDFYSLQKGDPAEAELLEKQSTLWPELINDANQLIDFSDTAALIENLDLVISVDTSTAHLAGALGKPVWVLNRYDSCWRWLYGRVDSPWYPTAKIYQQSKPGDWSGVLKQVRLDLVALVSTNNLH